MAAMTFVGLSILSATIAILYGVISAEIYAWCDSVTRNLIKFAIARLREDKRARFKEEWQSYLDDVPGQLGKLMSAVGFVVAAYSLADEDRRAQIREGLSQVLDQAEYAHRRSMELVQLIEGNKTLISLDGMRPLIERFKGNADKCYGGSKELRNLSERALQPPKTLRARLHQGRNYAAVLSNCEFFRARLEESTAMTDEIIAKARIAVDRVTRN